MTSTTCRNQFNRAKEVSAAAAAAKAAEAAKDEEYYQSEMVRVRKLIVSRESEIE